MPTTRSSLRRRGEADAPDEAAPPRRRPRQRARSVSPLGAVDPATRWLYEPHTVTGLVIGELCVCVCVCVWI